MKYSIITSDKFETKSWSGGTTTELYIFPSTASYLQRNFSFRLSTATVDVEKSEFTSLSGFSRKLMVLDGKATLFHEGRYSKLLSKFDVDAFEGDWQTSSVGKCTDFNLMTSGNAKGELKAVLLNDQKVENHLISSSCNWFFIYVFSGKICLNLNKETATINKGDLLVINNPSIKTLEIKTLEKSELIFCEVFD